MPEVILRVVNIALYIPCNRDGNIRLVRLSKSRHFHYFSISAMKCSIAFENGERFILVSEYFHTLKVMNEKLSVNKKKRFLDSMNFMLELAKTVKSMSFSMEDCESTVQKIPSAIVRNILSRTCDRLRLHGLTDFSLSDIEKLIQVRKNQIFSQRHSIITLLKFFFKVFLMRKSYRFFSSFFT